MWHTNASLYLSFDICDVRIYMYTYVCVCEHKNIVRWRYTLISSYFVAHTVFMAARDIRMHDDDESTNTHTQAQRQTCYVWCVTCYTARRYIIHYIFVCLLVCDRIFTFVARLRMPSCQFACVDCCVHFAFVVAVLYTLAHIQAHTFTHTNTSNWEKKKWE